MIKSGIRGVNASPHLFLKVTVGVVILYVLSFSSSLLIFKPCLLLTVVALRKPSHD